MYGMSYKTVGEALAYAVTHHGGQFRKDNITPYVVHPIGVADIVYEYGKVQFDPEKLHVMITAALFHDIIEDCPVTEPEMRAKWGDAITNIVVGLTNTSKLDRPELNRAERKALDAERLRYELPEVQFVKLADVLYNVGDLDALERGFALKFLGEKEAQVRAISQDWIDGDYGCVYATQAHWNLRTKCLDVIAVRRPEFEPKSDAGRTSFKKSHRAEGVNYAD